MADQTPSLTRCRLLELPAELRNTIYELCLTIESADGAARLIRCPHRSSHSVFAVLQTCRTIHAEAKSLFYICNRDIYLRFQDLDYFVKQAGTAALQNIKYLTIDETQYLVRHHQRTMAWEAIPLMTNLESVRVKMMRVDADYAFRVQRSETAGDVRKVIEGLGQVARFELVLVETPFPKKALTVLREGKFNAEIKAFWRQVKGEEMVQRETARG